MLCYPITSASIFPFLLGSKVSISIVASCSYEPEEISTIWISSLNAEIQPPFLPFVSQCSSISHLLLVSFTCLHHYSSLLLRRLPQNRLPLGQKSQLPLTWVHFSASLTKPMSRWSYLLLNKLDNSTEKNYLGVVQPLMIILLKIKILRQLKGSCYFSFYLTVWFDQFAYFCRGIEEVSFLCLFLPNGIKLLVCLYSTLFLHTFLF